MHQRNRAGSPFGIRWSSHTTTTERATHDIRVLLDRHEIHEHRRWAHACRGAANGPCTAGRGHQHCASGAYRPYSAERWRLAASRATCPGSCAATSARISASSVGGGKPGPTDSAAVHSGDGTGGVAWPGLFAANTSCRRRLKRSIRSWRPGSGCSTSSCRDNPAPDSSWGREGAPVHIHVNSTTRHTDRTLCETVAIVAPAPARAKHRANRTWHAVDTTNTKPPNMQIRSSFERLLQRALSQGMGFGALGMPSPLRFRSLTFP